MARRDIANRFPWINLVKAATSGYPAQELHLVGVSGGVDSRVLLHLLPMIGFRDLVVCHLNHNLRGTESREDSKFVSRLTRRLGLKLHMESLAQLPRKGSLEASAREARLQFFARAAEKFSTSSIFLAHHADDQVETFLFNLFRGTGSLDNAAIKMDSRVSVGAGHLLIHRPLLQVWKDEIYKFAAANRLQFREDSSNLSRQMVRNRVRHDLIPEIERLLGRPVKRAFCAPSNWQRVKANFCDLLFQRWKKKQNWMSGSCEICLWLFNAGPSIAGCNIIILKTVGSRRLKQCDPF